MTDTILAFLHARLNADEQVARAATPGHWQIDDETYAESIDSDSGVTVVGGSRWSGEASVFDQTQDARHIARHDPARVLAEVDAKRRMLARHQPHWMGGCRVCEAPHWGNQVCDHCYGQKWPCPDVRDLAAIHRDHPDYRQEWTP